MEALNPATILGTVLHSEILIRHFCLSLLFLIILCDSSQISPVSNEIVQFQFAEKAVPSKASVSSGLRAINIHIYSTFMTI